MANKPIDYDTFCSLLGEGFHTAFRKASDSPESVTIWNAIARMDREDWMNVIEFVAEPTFSALIQDGISAGEFTR
jgi:hypothetical protein